MKIDKKKHTSLEKISRRAMKSQVISHRIEGIYISKSDAEKIRKEVLQEFVNTSVSRSS